MIVERLNLSSGLPFDLLKVQKHLRATAGRHSEAVLSHAISAALELERYGELALLTQTIRVTLEDWGRKAWLPLPIAPMIDPLSPTVTADGHPFTGFAVISGLRPALRLTGDRPCGVIIIEYQAGFGDSLFDIPEDLRLAMADQAAATFDTRGAGDGKTSHASAISPHMARIAARYRRVGL